MKIAHIAFCSALLLMTAGLPPSLTAQEASAPLPWEYSQPSETLISRPRSVAEMLSLFGIDATEFQTFDGLTEGLTRDAAAQQRLLWRILFRLPQIGFRQWANVETLEGTLPLLVEDPAQHRGHAFRLRGQVRQVEREVVPATEPLHAEFQHYFRVEMELENGPVAARVYAREVPELWLQRDDLDEPAEAKVVFLGRVSEASGTKLVFVSTRLAWFPTRPGPGVTHDQAQLAQLGMDIGLFDRAREGNRTAFRASERDCFYALLRTVATEPAAIRRAADTGLELGPLLQTPQQHHGLLTRFSAEVRRITKILVDNEEVQDRYGIDHYYQLDAFVPLQNQVVVFGKPGQDARPTFAGSYPLTICTPVLPKGVTEGHGLDYTLDFSAVFFKLWAYRSRYVTAVDQQQRQLSPMLVSVEPVLVADPEDAWQPAWLGVCFLGLLAAIWWVVWRLSLSDKRFSQRRLRRDPPRPH